MHRIALLCVGHEATGRFVETVLRYEDALAGAGASLGDVRRAVSFGAVAAAVVEFIAAGLPVLIDATRVPGLLSAARTRAERRFFAQLETSAVVVVLPATADEKSLDRVSNALGARLVAAAEVVPAVKVVSRLRRQRLTMAAAESCTGGMLGAEVTAIAGSSEVFWGSMVTYSNEAKRAVLGVAPDTLERYGAVSEQTVREMARGARETSHADVAVAVSGIAGPGGGTPEKPVGTVWIACETDRNGSTARLLRLDGSRDGIRRTAVWECLSLIDELTDG